MLRIKLNKNDAVPSYRFLFGTGDSVTGTVENGILSLTFSEVITGGIDVGDRLMFIRKDCRDERLFTDYAVITGISEKSVSVKVFDDIPLIGTPKDVIMRYNIRSGTNAIHFLDFSFNGRHGFANEICDAVDNIKENITDDYSVYNKTLKRCRDDYFVYNDCFLYKAHDVISSTGKYDFPEDYSNQTDAVIKAKNQKIYDYIGSSGNNNTWTKSDGIIYLNKCIVPVLYDGTNDLHRIIWSGSTTTFRGFLEENIDEWGSTEFSCADERFYTVSGNNVAFNSKVEVYLVQTDIKVKAPLSTDFGTNLLQKESIEQKYFLEKNKIIDYEKHIFYPVFESNGVRKDVISIRYDIYLRQRLDYTEWKIDENGGWNDNNWPDGGDLVAYAGFDDDDIYYQKKKVSMSFLRLSLYNTKDRLTQSLLGYSTMFLDGATLYKKYVQKKNTPGMVSPIVENTSEPRLSLTFSCESKYKSEQSSEGFYLYLFPSLLESQEKEDGYSIVYMKVEFNNAKYGKTVPFIMPNDGTPPDNYVNQQGGYVDMNALFSDMYIRIGIRHDDDNNRYIWRFMDTSQESDIVIKLFEPKVNNGNNS